MEILLCGLKYVGLFFLITYTIYWFNLDMKFIYRFQKFLRKKYDSLERDNRI